MRKTYYHAAVMVVVVLCTSCSDQARDHLDPAVGESPQVSKKEDATRGEALAGAPLLAKGEPIGADAFAEGMLDPQRQKYIWDAEHVTHKLEWRFGKQIKAAWKTRDHDALTSRLREDFSGELLDLSKATQISKGSVTKYQVDRATQAADEATSEELSRWLIEVSHRVGDIRDVSFRVLEIDRVGEDATCWSAKIQHNAHGKKGDTWVSLRAKHRLVFQWESDQDLDTGRIVKSWQVESAEISQSPTILMNEVTAATGLGQLPIWDNWKSQRVFMMITFQMAVEDFDRDGFLDIALATLDQKIMLLKSDKDLKFEDVTADLNLPTINNNQRNQDFSVSWIDFDNDGFPDLILGGRLYHNQAGRSFVDVTGPAGIDFGFGPKGFAIADFDADGWLDVYVNRDQPDDFDPSIKEAWVGDASSGEENQLWRNRGDGTFEDVTQQSKSGGGRRHTTASCWLYADGDALPDLYLANDFGKNVLLRNRGDGTFEDISSSSETSGYATSMGVAAGDLDNDGTSEIYVANMYSKMGRRIIRQVSAGDYPPGIYEQILGACAGNRLYHKRADHDSFTEQGEALKINQIGWAYAPAITDFDNDGSLDIYATTGFLSFQRGKPDG